MPKILLVLPVILLCAEPGSPAYATSVADVPDAYIEVSDDRQKTDYLDAIADRGDSSTGNLFVFLIDTPNKDADREEDSVRVHIVQDRGQPRGAEYPTFVFRSEAGSGPPHLVFRTDAGKRLYVSEQSEDPSSCLISAESGYSDICLANLQGHPAPDLPGLRKDFWSDLIKLFGL